MVNERTLEVVHDTCERACAILQSTNDGDDLAPEHLKLVEDAVNGFLNEAGLQAFNELYENCKGGYKKPWFHVENLTIDNVGYVYWKGQQVEHYDLGWHRSPEAKIAAEELARRCRSLEERGIPVNSTNAIWKWKEGD